MWVITTSKKCLLLNLSLQLHLLLHLHLHPENAESTEMAFESKLARRWSVRTVLQFGGENVWCKLTQLTPLPLKPTAKQLIVPARLVLPWSNWKVDSQIWILLNTLLPAWWLHSREKQVSISQLTSGLQSIYISMFQVKGIAMIRCLAALRSKLCVLGQVCWEK